MNSSSVNMVSLTPTDPIYSPMPIPISLPSNALLSIGGFDARQTSAQFSSQFALPSSPASSGLSSLDSLIPNLGSIAPSASFLGSSVQQFSSFNPASVGANLYSSVLTQGTPSQGHADYFPALAASVGLYAPSANALAVGANSSGASNMGFDTTTSLADSLPQFSPPSQEQPTSLPVQQSAASHSSSETTTPVSSVRTRTDSHSSTTHHRSSTSLPSVPQSESAVSVLFAHVRRGTCSFNTLADDFIDRFKSNRDLALMDLLQVLYIITNTTISIWFADN